MALSTKGAEFVKKILRSKAVVEARPSQTMIKNFSSRYSNDENLEEPQQQMQNPPNPIPNRPLRGDRPRFQQQPTTDLFNRHSQNDYTKKRDDSQSDQSFLEQFKFGLEKIPSQQPQEDKISDPLQPPEDADEMFKKMKETGLIPNAVAMLDGLCKDGLVQEAMKLFGVMREKGTIPQVVVYTAVVDGFCKAHKLNDAKRIFKKMVNNGIPPNAFSYTVLIQGLYKCKCVDDAVEYCVEMLEAGHSPNVSTFVGLVDALCRDKGVDEAQTVIKNLSQSGLIVNDKAVKEFLDKKAPFSSLVWEAIFGRKTPHTSL